MFSSEQISAGDLKIISVFKGAFGKSGLIGTLENISNLNNPDYISLGEKNGKIYTLESINDTKSINDWYTKNPVRFIKYVSGKEEIFNNLFKQEKYTKYIESKKGPFNIKNYFPSSNIFRYFSYY